MCMCKNKNNITHLYKINFYIENTTTNSQKDNTINYNHQKRFENAKAIKILYQTPLNLSLYKLNFIEPKFKDRKVQYIFITRA